MRAKAGFGMTDAEILSHICVEHEVERIGTAA